MQALPPLNVTFCLYIAIPPHLYALLQDLENTMSSKNVKEMQPLVLLLNSVTTDNASKSHDHLISYFNVFLHYFFFSLLHSQKKPCLLAVNSLQFFKNEGRWTDRLLSSGLCAFLSVSQLSNSACFIISPQPNTAQTQHVFSTFFFSFFQLTPENQCQNTLIFLWPALFLLNDVLVLFKPSSLQL